MMIVISLSALIIAYTSMLYLLILAIASVRRCPLPDLSGDPSYRFVIIIPAHNEEDVIGATVRQLYALSYPPEMFSIHVVADHCSDKTAELARQAGAQVHLRDEGPRTGKGAALAWLLPRVLTDTCDAIVVFDADTRVDPNFLRVMAARLAKGERVIQGKHIISNPEDGWFPALAWAMFLIDNRFQNLGRVNLGLSAKLMGDAMCFRTDVLRAHIWGESLADDFELRQRLLLANIPIAYEPAAIAYGEAPQTWSQAQTQRARWLRGTHETSRRLRRHLLRQAIARQNMKLFDGAFQAYSPAYSTLALFCITCLLIHIILAKIGLVFEYCIIIVLWIIVVVILFLSFIWSFVRESSFKSILDHIIRTHLPYLAHMVSHKDALHKQARRPDSNSPWEKPLISRIDLAPYPVNR